MIRKPVAIIVGLILLLGGLFRCDAFSQETVLPDPPLLPDEYTILCTAEQSKYC